MMFKSRLNQKRDTIKSPIVRFELNTMDIVKLLFVSQRFGEWIAGQNKSFLFWWAGGERGGQALLGVAVEAYVSLATPYHFKTFS